MQFNYKPRHKYAEETAPRVGTFLANLDRAASQISNGVAPDDPESAVRDYALGETTLRTSFPGHPGYLGLGDKPSSIPNTYRGSALSGDHGKRQAQAMDDTIVDSLHGISSYRLHGVDYDPISNYDYDEPQSWIDTVGQRAYSSPRFHAAMLDHFAEGGGDNAKYFHSILSTHTYPLHYSLSGEPFGDGGPPYLNDGWDDESGKTYSKRWEGQNFSVAMMYWKAHRDVTMGKYDHLEDPVEDHARNALRSSPVDPKESKRWRPFIRPYSRDFNGSIDYHPEQGFIRYER